MHRPAPFQSLFVGQTRVDLPEVDSTNTYAALLLSASASGTGVPLPEGFLVTADLQTAGRGQRETTWQSDERANVVASIVLYPTFLPLHRQFLLSQAVALAVLDFLEPHLTHPACLKWPNDILVDDKKICGILIECALQGSTLLHAIVGIGLNVNQRQWPHNMRHRTTSLAQEEGKTFLLEDCYARLCLALERRYLQLRAGAYDAIEQGYAAALWRRGVVQGFKLSNGTFKQGVIEGVNGQGQLLVRLNPTPAGHGGELHAFNTKEISPIWT